MVSRGLFPFTRKKKKRAEPNMLISVIFLVPLGPLGPLGYQIVDAPPQEGDGVEIIKKTLHLMGFRGDIPLFINFSLSARPEYHLISILSSNNSQHWSGRRGI